MAFIEILYGGSCPLHDVVWFHKTMKLIGLMGTSPEKVLFPNQQANFWINCNLDLQYCSLLIHPSLKSNLFYCLCWFVSFQDMGCGFSSTTFESSRFESCSHHGKETVKHFHGKPVILWAMTAWNIKKLCFPKPFWPFFTPKWFWRYRYATSGSRIS